MNLYLVRHAHAEWLPDEGRPLSLRGMRDAVRLADRLADRSIEAVYSSPYRRVIQTVSALAVRRKLPIQIEDRFRERTLGNWSANTFEEAVSRTWQDAEYSWPGGESNKAAQTRAIEALDELIIGEPAEHIVLGTHGNLLTLILNHYDPQVGFVFWSRLTMPDVYQLETVGGRHARYTRLWMPKC